MLRWLAVSLMVFACGGSQREVSKIKYTHVQCSDCGIEPGSEPRYELPDVERAMPPPQTAMPANESVEPTCKLVAETLVSLELGDYAEPEQRAPRVAAEEKRCIAAKLARDDRQCVIDSNDRASVVYCAPALFPDVKQDEALSVEQCKSLADTMRGRTDQFINAQPANKNLYLRQLGAAIEACRADRWNAPMAQCASHSIPVYWQNCAYVQPYGMWRKLERRLEKARGA